MQLRPYQLDMLNDLRVAVRPVESGGLGHKRVCAVLPTGGGKTVIFTAMGSGAVKYGKTVWMVAHREELIYQISDKLTQFGVHHGIIKPGVPETPSQVQVCMIQTVKNRLAKSFNLGKYPDLLIIDECHHTPSATYDELLKMMPGATIVVGFTATPERLDGKGLGNHYDHMVLGPREHELISLGYLVPPVVFRGEKKIDTSKLHTRMGDFVRSEVSDLMDKPGIIGDTVTEWKKHAGGLSTVVFCISIEHAEHVAKAFNEAGIRAASVDGGMGKDERRSVLNSFREGRTLVLTSCDLISEGFDLPTIRCCILARPTKSLGLYRQQVGRSLRIEDGKTEAIILDQVNNYALHGLPDDPKDWSLEGARQRKKEEEDEDDVHTCPDCFRCYRGKKCPHCEVSDRGGGNAREIDEHEGELKKVESARKYLEKPQLEQLRECESREQLLELCGKFEIEEANARRLLVTQAHNLPDLRRVQKLFGYKWGWAEHLYGNRHGQDKLEDAIIGVLQDIALKSLKRGEMSWADIGKEAQKFGHLEKLAKAMNDLQECGRVFCRVENGIKIYAVLSLEAALQERQRRLNKFA